MSETVTNNGSMAFASEQGMETWPEALCAPLP